MQPTGCGVVESLILVKIHSVFIAKPLRNLNMVVEEYTYHCIGALLAHRLSLHTAWCQCTHKTGVLLEG